MTPTRIALVGNPNAGKTTVFNALCGAAQKTGNYAGVTVEKKVGRLRAERNIEVIDLPGAYSLKPKSADEEITERVILGHAGRERVPDLNLLVLDASNLKRSLYIAEELREKGAPVLAVLTMRDVAERRGFTVDSAALEKAMGVRVVEVTRGAKDHIENLNQAILDALNTTKKKAPRKTKINPTIDERYAAINAVVRKAVTKNLRQDTTSARIDSFLTHRIFGLVAFSVLIGSMFLSIYAGAQPMMDAIDYTMKTVAGWARTSLTAYPLTASLISDGAIAGAGSVFVFLPQIMILFFFIAVFEETGYLARAAFLMDKLLHWTGLNGRAFIPLLSSFACAVPAIMSARVMPSDRTRMATILITPLMSCSARLPVYILFIGSFIEPRYGALWAAVTLFGMHLVGIVVAMPLAWLLNRKVLKTGQSPFILELPEYRMPHWPNVWRRVYDAAMDFLRGVAGIIFALSITIWALAYFPHAQKTTDSVYTAFSQEKKMPVKEVHSLATETKLSEKAQALKSDLDNALRAAHLRESYLGHFGRWVQPVFAPLGFDWKISVAILAAFPAREVFISTLGIIYSVADTDAEPEALSKKLLNEKKKDGSPLYSVLLAVTVMIFFALCAQCMSTLAAIRRELRSTRWAITVFIVLTSIAYLMAMAVWQVGSLFT